MQIIRMMSRLSSGGVGEGSSPGETTVHPPRDLSNLDLSGHHVGIGQLAAVAAAFLQSFEEDVIHIVGACCRVAATRLLFGVARQFGGDGTHAIIIVDDASTSSAMVDEDVHFVALSDFEVVTVVVVAAHIFDGIIVSHTAIMLRGLQGEVLHASRQTAGEGGRQAACASCHMGAEAVVSVDLAQNIFLVLVEIYSVVGLSAWRHLELAEKTPLVGCGGILGILVVGIGAQLGCGGK
mmetsp:Transcript_28769/g.83446  ORF Transcript_28769/g.83446 Transcript_28769/m.83446 type:complete len:237 (+) Transcript_28769:811-1521(+)